VTPGGILRRLFSSAFFMDAGFFLVLAAIPYKVLSLGGGPVMLGLVPAVSSLSYIFLTLATGRLSDHIGRYRLTRYGNLAFVAFSALAFQAPTLPRFLLVMPLLGLGASLYWPVIQAAVGDLSGGRKTLERNIGRFNVSWSAGKTLGYIAGGMLLAHYDFRSTFLAGIGFAALSFFALPREENLPDELRHAHRNDAAESRAQDNRVLPDDRAPFDEEEAPAPSPAERATFRRMAWLANAAAFGAGGVLNHQLPKWFQSAAWDEDLFGLFLGGTFFFQTLVLLLLAGRVRFTYSLRRLLLPQVLAGAALLAIPALPSFVLLLALAPLLGASFGVCYAASIFYSLHTDVGKGRNTGIHESLIGAGIFLLPLLGGFAARFSGRLGAPYLLAGTAVLIAAALQYVWWRRGRA